MGGTGAHSVFILVDKSGSMNGYNRLTFRQDAAKTFIDLLNPPSYNGSGEWVSGSKV